MNENLENDPLAGEVFVFSPSKGIRLNINPQNFPGADDATNRFELIGNNPLIKNNKNNNLAEYDYYIEDPTNPEIKNELVNDIVFSSGRCCLKKNAIDILYCSFDVFFNEQKFTLKNNPSFNFYINILLMYPPELKHNSLLQYFAILHKILENNEITLDYKYLVTNRALEIEWEKCSFGKYNHFKTFFSTLKKFFKLSPLFLEEPFLEEGSTNIYQDLLKRTLAGRALTIIQYIVDCDDQLKLLMLFKTIEWFQKLETNKMLLNLNLGFLANKGRDKVAVDLLKQMYGRPAQSFNLQGAETQSNKSSGNKPEEGAKIKQNLAPIKHIGSSSDQTTQPSEAQTEASLELSHKPKLGPTKSSELEINNQERLRRGDSNSSKRGLARESLREEAAQESLGISNKMSGHMKNKNKVNLFFDLQSAQKYQEDFAGRINNFLKKASKLGYEYSNSDKEKIDSIVTKFKGSFTIDQLNDLIRNYKKFCGDHQILVNPQVIHTLESTKASQTTPSSKPKQQDSEKSKSPPNNRSALKMLKTTSSLQSIQGKDVSIPQLPPGKSIQYNEDAPDPSRLSTGKVLKDIERRSREKEVQEELKGHSSSEAKDNKGKIEKKKSDFMNSKTFNLGGDQTFFPRGFFERTNRNNDE